MAELTPLTLSLMILSVAVVVLYAGSRLLWASIASAGLWRGVFMASPVIALGLIQSATSPASAVALMVSAAVLAVTLGLGVSTLDIPADDAAATPMFKSLLPLAAVVCLAGFHGELSLPIILGIAAAGGLALWSADGERVPTRVPSKPWLALPAAVLLLTGVVAVVVATMLFQKASRSAAATPVVVLLCTPAVCLALLGLLTAEAKEIGPQMPQETAVGVALATLGIGLPLVVVVGRVAKPAYELFTGPRGGLLPIAATRPTDPAVFMPLSTWRVDSVLLLVVAIFLLPFGTGRMRLGRLEGVALIVLFLAYAAVATRVGATSG